MKEAAIRALTTQERNALLSGVFYHTSFQKWVINRGGIVDPTAVLERESRSSGYPSETYKGDFLIYRPKSAESSPGFLHLSHDRNHLNLKFLLSVPEETDFQFEVDNVDNFLGSICWRRMPLYVGYNLSDTDKALYSPLIITSDLVQGIVLGEYSKPLTVVPATYSASRDFHAVKEEPIEEQPAENKLEDVTEKEFAAVQLTGEMSREDIIEALTGSMSMRLSNYEETLTTSQLAERVGISKLTMKQRIFGYRSKGYIGKPAGKIGLEGYLSFKDTFFVLNVPQKGDGRQYKKDESVANLFNITPESVEILRSKGILERTGVGYRKEDLRGLLLEVYLGADVSERKADNASGNGKAVESISLPAQPVETPNDLKKNTF